MFCLKKITKFPIIFCSRSYIVMGCARFVEKTLMLGGIGGRRKRGRQRMMRWLDGITDSIDLSLSELRRDGDGQGGVACCDSWGRKESDRTERLN